MSGRADADVLSDIVVPIIIIAILFVVNAVIFMYIMRQRKRIPQDEDFSRPEGGIEMVQLS